MRSMVEGRSGQTLRNNHSNHPIQLIENIARRDPQHGISVRFKVDLTKAIDLRNAVMFVNSAVDLNQQARRKTSEVGNVAANGVLAAEF